MEILKYTKFLDWKHHYKIGNEKMFITNNEFRFETVYKLIRLETY